MTHLISTEQFQNQESLIALFKLADDIKHHALTDPFDRLHSLPVSSVARGKILATLFLEPSTRTRPSFEAAMIRMGGSVISVNESNSSITKGESIEDMVATVGHYADLIVIRSPVKDSVASAAKVSRVPVINAGDGTGEHPTQSLLDLYTIRQHRGLDNLRVAICGDLLHGRTVHSLVRLLSLFENLTLMLISPTRLGLPDEMVEWLKAKNVKITQYHSVKEVFDESPHVMYMTRLQKERMVDYSIHVDKWKHFSLSWKETSRLPEDCLIMHPGPRNDEIAREVDLDKRSLYLTEQPLNGVRIRQALIYSMLCGKTPVRNKDLFANYF